MKFKIEERILYKTLLILNWFLVVFGVTPYVIQKTNKITMYKFTTKKKYYIYVVLYRLFSFLIALKAILIFDVTCYEVYICIYKILFIVNTLMTLFLSLILFHIEHELKFIIGDTLKLIQVVHQFSATRNIGASIGTKPLIIFIVSTILTGILIAMDVVLNYEIFQYNIFATITFYITYIYIFSALTVIIFIINLLLVVYEILNKLLISAYRINNIVLNIKDIFLYKNRANEICEKIGRIFGPHMIFILTTSYISLIVQFYTVIADFELFSIEFFILTNLWNTISFIFLIILAYYSDQLTNEVIAPSV